MQTTTETEGKVTCISKNAEKYISFSIDQLRFIDSAQFVLSSLDGLVKASNPLNYAHHSRLRAEPSEAYNPSMQGDLLLRVYGRLVRI